MSFIDPAIFRGNQYNGGVGCVFGYDSNVRRIGREGNAERPAAQRAIVAKRDAVERAGRGDGHGAIRRRQSGAREQPTGQQRLGKRHRHRETSGGAEHRKAVGKARARATQLFGNPSERQPGVGDRTPERPPPSAVLGPVDGLGIGELGKNSCRRFGDYMVAFAHDRCFCRFPARILACGHSH